jgi:hypothetical protein
MRLSSLNSHAEVRNQTPWTVSARRFARSSAFTEDQPRKFSRKNKNFKDRSEDFAVLMTCFAR